MIFRFIVFSPHAITSIGVSIDNAPVTSDIKHVQGPLFVCEWDPTKYDKGLHRITITAKVSRNQESPLAIFVFS